MFCKSPKLFSSRCKNYRKSKFFFKKNPQNLHLDSPNAVLTPLGEGFFPKTKSILVKVLRILKNYNFSLKKNFSICFIGHLNCGFWNRIVNCLLNAIKFSPQMTRFVRSRQKNYNKIIIFKKCFSSKTSPGHVEWSSEKHTAFCSAINLGNLLLKVRQTFPQGTRGTKKPFFSHYFYFFLRAPLDAQNALLANPAEICSPKFQIFSLKVQN